MQHLDANVTGLYSCDSSVELSDRWHPWAPALMSELKIVCISDYCTHINTQTSTQSPSSFQGNSPIKGSCFLLCPKLTPQNLKTCCTLELACNMVASLISFHAVVTQTVAKYIYITDELRTNVLMPFTDVSWLSSISFIVFIRFAVSNPLDWPKVTSPHETSAFPCTSFVIECGGVTVCSYGRERQRDPNVLKSLTLTCSFLVMYYVWYISCSRESIPLTLLWDKAVRPPVLICLPLKCPATRSLSEGVRHLQASSYIEGIYIHTRNQVIWSNQVKAWPKKHCLNTLRACILTVWT